MNHDACWPLLDDYVDDELSAAERHSVEVHLQGCATCREQVAGLRDLVGAARSLPAEVDPPRDLWPEVATGIATPRRRRWWVGAAVAGGTALLAAACAGVIGASMLLSGGPDLGPATAELRGGDLPAARSTWLALSDEHPGSEEAAIGAAYVDYLAGDYAAADRRLAGVEHRSASPEQIRLRRALVALREGDLDRVREHATASALPAGQILAAEVHLADAEHDEAIELLTRVSDRPGPVGDTARTYLDLLGSSDSVDNALAEVTALWALGERATSCELSASVVPELREYEREELLVLWAGRCVTSGRPDHAEGLLAELDFPPPGHGWRVFATEAMIMVARGETEPAIQLFDSLERGGAPSVGLAHARATAASLTEDPEVAIRLVSGQRSPEAARSLAAAGALDAARQAAPEDTFLARYLTHL